MTIEENANTYYGAEAAVDKREQRWLGPYHLKIWIARNLGFSSEPPATNSRPSEVDIVTPSIRDLDFLNQWREFFQGFHVIIIQDGDPNKQLVIPDWVDYELYVRPS